MKKQLLNFKHISELESVIRSSKSSNKETKRAQAILMSNDGTSSEIIKRFTTYSKRHALTLKKNYLIKGLESIKDKEKKKNLLLNRSQKAEVIDILNNKKPSDFGYATDFWTTPILGDLIKKKYEISYKSKKTYHLMFKEAKYTFRKPEKVYERRSQAEVDEWIKNTKPIIEEAMKDENTVILTEDEMILSTQTTTQYVWLPKDVEPAKIQIATKRKNKSIYGFLNIKTGQENAFVTEWQNMFITVEILKKMMEVYPNKKLLIIWDGAGWHRGSEVQKFIEENKPLIKTILFPAASPDLNPQEHVWKAGRSNVTHNKFISDIDVAAEEFVTFLNEKTFDYSLMGFCANL